MITLQIKVGEYLWSQEGTHILDSKGFAIRATEDTEIEMEESVYERILPFISFKEEVAPVEIPEETPEETPEELPLEETPEEEEEYNGN